MNVLFDPVLIAHYFFHYRPDTDSSAELTRQIAQEPSLGLSLLPARNDPSGLLYRDEQGCCRLDWFVAHDTAVIRLAMGRPGKAGSGAWLELRTLLEGMEEKYMQEAEITPLGASLLLWAWVEEINDPLRGWEALAVSLDLDPTASLPSTALSDYGCLWRLEERKARWNFFEYALLTPRKLVAPTREAFVLGMRSSLARIELYLHKCYHQADQYMAVRSELLDTRQKLEEVAMELIRVRAPNPRATLARLDRTSHQVTTSLQLAAPARIVLEGLRANLINYEEHWPHVNGNNPILHGHRRRIKRAIQQIELDLDLCQTTFDSTSRAIELLSAIEETRAAQSQVIVAIAAGVLAAIFGTSTILEIWQALGTEAGLALPHPLVRLGLSMAFSLTLGVGLYWLLAGERRRGLLILLACFIILATIMLNAILA